MPTKIAPIQPDDDFFDDDGWQDMPIIRESVFASGLDEEDQKKYHYVPSSKAAQAELRAGGTSNATGTLLDTDDWGNEWRSKVDHNESEYTRLRGIEEDEADEVHLRTKYLFDEDKAMTPLNQMQATKNMLTEAQRIAYVGVCQLTCREMAQALRQVKRKELKPALQDLEMWSLKIMGRLYYHMELATLEQKMIESLGEHGVLASDLVPALMTTRTVANPEYDPLEALRVAEAERLSPPDDKSESLSIAPDPSIPPSRSFQTTARVLDETSVPSEAIKGVTTSLSTTNKDITLDIRWTILCDLFLILIADSVYDARSRVLLEFVALKLGLGWLDVVKFESRVTEALEIQEGVETMENQDVLEGRKKSSRNKRYMMVGLATLGGGLVIGLSAGLLAPVIGAGLGAAFTTIGISGTTGFLAGAGGAAVITTGGVLTGSSIAAKGMVNRTKQVRTFELLPLHNNKRVNCIVTVPGFLSGVHDDPRLPFSVLDPIVGDVISVLWEPEMIQETGAALKILTGEVLTQLGQTVLQATVLTALMGALQWPIVLTKLGYLIDNPWNNALDRAKAAGSVLADVLIQRNLGVRPITLIGFSLGARVIFYALVELARKKAYGIVQDVFLLGGTLTASTKTWLEVRSVVSGRFVNAYAKNDWVLNYLFRATSGGLSSVAGLGPINNVPGLENIDVTDKIAGHMSYRTFLPLILDQLGFPVFADYFDEPVEPEFDEERIVVKDGEQLKKKGWFSKKKKLPVTPAKHVQRPPSTSTFSPGHRRTASSTSNNEATINEKLEQEDESSSRIIADNSEVTDSNSSLPLRAGFDLSAMKEIVGTVAQSVQAEETHLSSSHTEQRKSQLSTPPVASSSQLKLPKDNFNTLPSPQLNSALPSVDEMPYQSPVPLSAPREEDDDEEFAWQTGPIVQGDQEDFFTSYPANEQADSQRSQFLPADIASTRDPSVAPGLSFNESFHGGPTVPQVHDPWAMPPIPDKSPGYLNPWDS